MEVAVGFAELGLLNDSTKPGFPPMVTKRTSPAGDNFMLSALLPIGKAAPTGVSAPELASIEKTEIVLEPEFATYKKLPAASMANKFGDVPTMVRGVTSVSAPSVATVNSETSLSPLLAAYRNFLEG